jgi:hypothetical protein
MQQPRAYFPVPGPIDWAALARQKQWLLSLAGTCAEAAGLVPLLDALQDAAVRHAGVPAAVVVPEADDAG